MSDEHALLLVNQLKDDFAELVRTTIESLKDGKVTAVERWELGMDAMKLGTTVIMLVRGCDAATRDRMLHVLEYGVFTLPDGT